MLGIPIVTQFNGDGIKKAIKSFKQLETASDKVKFVLKAGAVAGVAVSFANRGKKGAAKAAHETTTLADLEK